MAFAAMASSSYPANGTANIEYGIASEAITAGYAVRRTASNRIEIANATANATSDIVGVAVSSAAANQPIAFAPPGTTLVTSGLTAGTAYYLGGGTDEGEIGLFADADTAGVYGTLVGVALSATSFYIIGKALGVAL